MDFKEINVADRALIEHHLRLSNPCVCDFAMHSLFCWRHTYPAYQCVMDGFLVLRLDVEATGEYAYSRPYGEGDFSHIIPHVLDDAAARGETARWFALDDDAIQVIRTMLPHYGIAYHRGFSDYVYSAGALQSLAGKKYQPKRNHLHQFMASYDYRYETLSPAHFPDCVSLLALWQQQYLAHCGLVDDNTLSGLRGESSCIREAFTHYEALGFYGGVLYVGSQLVAFTYGSAISDDTFCTHVEKADENHVGAFTAINQLFAQHLPSRYQYVNRENDMSIQGLRQAKESYHPLFLRHKLLALPLTPDMRQVRQLWLTCFPDDTPSEAEQFLLTRYDGRHALFKRHDGSIVSMLHIVSFHSVAYVFAVATHPHYRRNHLAGQLVAEAVERCRQEGYESVCLIPGNDDLRGWYAGMGFQGSIPVVFHTHDDYCFGTGNPASDKAMILHFHPCPLPDRLVLVE